MSNTTPRRMKPGGATWNEIVARDGADSCVYCGTTERLLLDHKVPRSRGGGDELENLQILCADCNSHKGARTEAEASKHVRHASRVSQAGFTLIPNAVLLDARLSIGARLLYGVLKSYAWQSDEVWPGQERVAAELGISVRSFREYGRELVAAGLVRTWRRGRGMTNIYVLLEPSSDRQKTTHLDRQDSTPKEYEVKEADLSVEPDGSTALAVIGKTPETTQTLVAEIVDEARSLDIPLPKRVTGQLAKYVKDLADEGYSFDVIRAGVARMMERRVVQPALLANFVTEAALAARPAATNGRRYGRGIRNDELEAVAQRLEQEGR